MLILPTTMIDDSVLVSALNGFTMFGSKSLDGMNTFRENKSKSTILRRFPFVLLARLVRVHLNLQYEQNSLNHLNLNCGKFLFNEKSEFTF